MNEDREVDSRHGALVLFSGGQDSATSLAWALARFHRVETIGFSYGQKHRIEMEVREQFLCRVSALNPSYKERSGPDHVVKLDLVGELTRPSVSRPGQHSMVQQGHFTSGRRYLPGRNLLMLSLASVVAFRRDINTLVSGVSEAEYSGYPDCREVSIAAIQHAIALSSGFEFDIATPLMSLKKAGVWDLAFKTGGEALVGLILEHTHTCYQGNREIHEWGYGCGNCPACDLRAKGWMEFKRAGPS